MSNQTLFEKHATTVLVSIITAIFVGIGVTSIQNNQGISRIETKIDFMKTSFDEYKIRQEKDYKALSDRIGLLEELVYKVKVK